MKKGYEVIRPFLSILFAVVMYLLYLNNFSAQADAATITVGVFAVVFATAYLGTGIVSTVLGAKEPPVLRRVFGILAVTLFPLFFFIETVCCLATLNATYGPVGWIIAILSILASLGFIGVYIPAKLTKKPLLCGLARLALGVFVIVLILTALFTLAGNPRDLGDLPIIPIVFHTLYVGIAVPSVLALSEPEEIAPPAEEPVGEEAPAEEAPVEEPSPEEPEVSAEAPKADEEANTEASAAEAPEGEEPPTDVSEETKE